MAARRGVEGGGSGLGERGTDLGRGNGATAVGWRGGKRGLGERESTHHSLCAASMVSFGLLWWWAFFC
jgi:hypothetical protein